MNKSHGVDAHMVTEKRKTFVAREDLLRTISEIARENGKSLYETVNEIFESAILFQKTGLKMDKALEDCGKMRAAREAGYILCLENLWSEINEVAYSASRADASSAWRNAGLWFGKKHVAGQPDGCLASMKKELESSLWNVSEFSMKWDAQGERVEIDVIAPRFSRNQSELFASFFEGMLSAIGLCVNHRESGCGFIRVVGRRQAEQKRGDAIEKP
ncbi:MAG: hypothetical protein QFX34_04975 [Candidatus Verstraetearchaeota archaeon]|nr:hypothetical protein [Candidatus Verstraetearchaeota archaeon]